MHMTMQRARAYEGGPMTLPLIPLPVPLPHIPSAHLVALMLLWHALNPPIQLSGENDLFWSSGLPAFPSHDCSAKRIENLHFSAALYPARSAG